VEEQALNEAKQNLEAELEAVARELKDLGAKADGTMEVSLDEGFADAAHTTSERSTVLSLVDTLQSRAENLRQALNRIEDGTYGKCVSCGNEIQPARLEAIPSSKYCITCAQKASNS
jgi:RNA polymerase-binding transcription factor DksA